MAPVVAAVTVASSSLILLDARESFRRTLLLKTPTESTDAARVKDAPEVYLFKRGIFLWYLNAIVFGDEGLVSLITLLHDNDSQAVVVAAAAARESQVENDALLSLHWVGSAVCGGGGGGRVTNLLELTFAQSRDRDADVNLENKLDDLERGRDEEAPVCWIETCCLVETLQREGEVDDVDDDILSTCTKQSDGQEVDDVRDDDDLWDGVRSTEVWLVIFFLLSKADCFFNRAEDIASSPWINVSCVCLRRYFFFNFLVSARGDSDVVTWRTSARGGEDEEEEEEEEEEEDNLPVTFTITYRGDEWHILSGQWVQRGSILARVAREMKEGEKEKKKKEQINEYNCVS